MRGVVVIGVSVGLHGAVATYVATLVVPARTAVRQTVQVAVIVAPPEEHVEPGAVRTAQPSPARKPGAGRERGGARVVGEVAGPSAAAVPGRWASLRGDGRPVLIQRVVPAGTVDPVPALPLLPLAERPREVAPAPRSLGVEVDVPLACPSCILIGVGRALELHLTRADEVTAALIAADQFVRHQTGDDVPARPAWQPKNPGAGLILPIAHGRFDLSEAIAGDEVIAREKARYLDVTREARAAVAEEDRARRERAAVRLLGDRLEALWRDTRIPAAQRRRLLFELWDECEERGIGLTARATITGFIGRRLPLGSAEAFAPDEVEALNERRRSRMWFAPYRR